MSTQNEAYFIPITTEQKFLTTLEDQHIPQFNMLHLIESLQNN